MFILQSKIALNAYNVKDTFEQNVSVVMTIVKIRHILELVLGPNAARMSKVIIFLFKIVDFM